MRRVIAMLVIATGLSGCAVHPDGGIGIVPVAVAPAPIHAAPRPVVVARPWGWRFGHQRGPGWGHRRW